MLLDQARALQAIFVNLARRANKQKYLRQWEAYIRAALKAQEPMPGDAGDPLCSAN